MSCPERPHPGKHRRIETPAAGSPRQLSVDAGAGGRERDRTVITVTSAASISVTAKGAPLEMHSPATFTGPVRVQLQRGDRAVCFENTWFKACYQANLNGPYVAAPGTHTSATGAIDWIPWRGFTQSMASTVMMIR